MKQIAHTERITPATSGGPARPACCAASASRWDEGETSYRHLLGEPCAQSNGLLTWLHVLSDYLRGFWVFPFVGPFVAVFGSTRVSQDDPKYQLARRLGTALARRGLTVLTGGGPGIMEAANRGAKEAGGRSVGCNLKLPWAQTPNPYLDRCVTLHHFSVRKALLRNYACAFVLFPGGAGALDEVFEALPQMQTGRIKHFPIVLMGRDYWQGVTEFIEKLARVDALSSEELRLVCAADSVEDALVHLDRHTIVAPRPQAVARPPMRAPLDPARQESALQP